MADLGSPSELKLIIPNKGDTDWTEMIKAAFEAIATHDHVGVDGTGIKINKGAIVENAVTGDELASDAAVDEYRAVDTNHIKDNAVITAKITDANVTLAKVENVSAARLIVGNSSNRPTSVDVIGDITISNTGVTTIGTDKVVTGMILDGDVTNDKIATDNITVDKKYTKTMTLSSDDQDILAGLSADKSFIIHYKIKDGSDFQTGTLTGNSPNFIVDEFVGDDTGATFDYSGNNIHINDADTCDFTYSIEFLE